MIEKVSVPDSYKANDPSQLSKQGGGYSGFMRNALIGIPLSLFMLITLTGGCANMHPKFQFNSAENFRYNFPVLEKRADESYVEFRKRDKKCKKQAKKDSIAQAGIKGKNSRFVDAIIYGARIQDFLPSL